MEKSKDIKDIFKKYIENKLTKRDYDMLLEFVRNPESEAQVKALFDSHLKDIEVSKKATLLDDYDSQFLLSQIIDQIEIKGKKKAFKTPRISFCFKIAAGLILFFGTAYCFFQNDFINNKNKNKVVSSPLKIDSNAITLTLSDGNIKVISDNGEEKILDKKGKVLGTQKGNQITYSDNKKEIVTKAITETLEYNELTVPYGKLFDLELSDGTLVKLNAGSSIRYPVKFLKGLERKVFLNGEAFFEVAKDKKHPFIVNTNAINVEVLGTSFNMSYYPEDTDINTVLVEGSVKIYEESDLDNSNNAIMLTPGHKAAWNKNNKKMNIHKVETQLYTAWKDGVLLFKKSSYSNIIKKLERHYDVVIENHYPFLASQVYTATFKGQEETIEDVLEAFKEDTPFKYIKVNNNNKIIITEP